MAVRSGAGTGVVVSLVVFILTTFFLLFMTIIFYSGQKKALVAQAEADKTLATYIQSAQRNNETFKGYEDAARSRGQSVTMYLHGELRGLTQYVDGAPNTSIDQLKAGFQRLGVEPDGVIRAAFQDTTRAFKDREAEIDRLNSQLASFQEDNDELRAQAENMRQAQRDQNDAVEQQIVGYRQAVDDFQQDLEQTVADLELRVDRQAQQYQARISGLQDEIDQLGQERVVHLQRIDDLEKKVRQGQLTPQDPSLLVDGQIIDSAGGNDQVFIDRGRQHHIVLGMTFEVFDDAAALQQVNQTAGVLPRGKGSLLVIKVGETTSTCKVVRSVPGRPVVRHDVIANSVYDPNYEFKFLIHGKFDVDGDGRPTEAEAEYLRSLVVDWGGQVVHGDELPGDLDFLVLGEEPPLPVRLRDNAPAHEMELWVDRRKAYDTYDRMKRRATDAQIPVLNANRFFILTGYNVR